ncbi:MAG: ABC-type transport auxiliary lipoprotein family protein [Lacunisphaera sp.]
MKTLSRLVALSTLLGLVGCNILPEPQKDAVRYFTLSTPAMQAGDDQASATKDHAEFHGTTVRPVQIAGHLRERSMAVRVAENEVIYLDEVRWAQPLGDAITNLLRERLSDVGGNNVVTVQIHNCEPLRFKNDAVELAATWEIVALGGGTPIRGEFTSAKRTWDGKDYRALVSEMHGAVEELGDAIASAIAAKK